MDVSAIIVFDDNSGRSERYAFLLFSSAALANEMSNTSPLATLR